jgi:HSP20 family protein
MLPALRRRGAGTIAQPLNVLQRDFESLRRDINHVFESWFTPDEDWEEEITASYPMDVYEEDGKILVDAELPGFDKKDIEVSVNNGILCISAERKSKKHNGKTHVRERQYKRVERSFTLPATVEDQKADAKFANGVLHLELPISEEAKAHAIKIP